jgi:hypothetical protein
MSRNYNGAAPDHQPHQHAHTAPTTQQIRNVGQRRRESEEKLEHHLAEARGRDGHDSHLRENATGPAGEGRVDGGDVAAIQNDDRLTAADRVDLIANQALSAPGGTQAPETASGGQ